MTILSDRPVMPMPAPVHTDHRPSASAARRRHASGWIGRLRSEGSVVVLCAMAAYISVAILLDFVYKIFPLDAVSRMANGFYILYSRDPHLAAVGFVWNPLQSFAVVPLLVFKDLWPALANRDVAASIVTVVAATAAVHQVHAALTELGVRRGARLLLTGGFALNPMIVFYAGNGMSEALYVFTLVAASRYLLRWSRQDDLRSLVYAAVALGCAYLDRNEAVGSAALGGLFVLAVTFRRAPGVSRARLMAALTDLTVFLMPFAAVLVGWATASYVVTGQLFAQFTSQYGNSAQLTEGGANHYTLAKRLVFDVGSIEFLAPLLPVVVVVALIVGLRRRDLATVGPIAILGGGLAFDALGILANGLQPWYRFFILAVPLDVLLLGYVVARRKADPVLVPKSPTTRHNPRRWTRTSVSVAAAGCFAFLALGPSVPSAALGMFSQYTHGTESQELGAIFLARPTKVERQFAHHFAHIESIDAYLDRMHLPEGSIVADTAGNCTPQIVTTVDNPKVFVITSDRDFQQILADPLTFHAGYLLDPRPVGVDVADALNVAFPTLYDSGAGFARLVHQFPSDGSCAVYRLYKVTGHPV